MQHIKQVMSCQKFFWCNSVTLSIGYGNVQAMHSYKISFGKYSFLECIDIQNQNLFCFHSPEMYPLITLNSP